jgi:hypothetical protein
MPEGVVDLVEEVEEGAISSSICSGVQKMWASSCEKVRTRERPWVTPERS